MEKKIEISMEEYNLLKDCQEQLYALEAGGVDNWEWYSDSLQEYYSSKEKE
jgi:hypothetical protein